MRNLDEILTLVHVNDPVKGIWRVSQLDECDVWCDASSIATGVVIEESGNVIEDGSWLRKRDDKAHINLAELESVIKGVNLALKWGFTKVNLYTDSATVFGWVTSTLTRSHKPKIYGLSEMLVKRRLQLLDETCKSYGLDVHNNLVISEKNTADALTRVKDDWIKNEKKHLDGEANNISCTTIEEIHNKNHFGSHKTLYSCQQFGLQPSLQEVKDVVNKCNQCKSIDPNPIKWNQGSLEVQQVWQRLACDVTHYGKKKYLTIIDCGPSRFCIWRRINDESGKTIANELASVFRERSPPEELLIDNSKSFRSEDVKAACDKFGVHLIYRCANRPAANGIIERNHKTIKTAAARSCRDPLDAVFWYNILPRSKSEESIPSNFLGYKWRFPIKAPSPTTERRKFIRKKFILLMCW